MNIISKLSVKKLWGSRDIEINFNKDVNIFIGRNGTGKTTIINLISSILNLDTKMLNTIDFEYAEIVLQEHSGAKKPSIEIQRLGSSDRPFCRYALSVKKTASSKKSTYTISTLPDKGAIFENLFIFDKDDEYHSTLEIIKRMSNLTWLTVDRGKIDSKDHTKNYSSTIDQKLNDFQNNFEMYCLNLFRFESEERAKFQETILLSLLTGQSRESVTTRVKKLDLVEEEKGLRDIFTKYHIDITKFESKLDKHITVLKTALEKLKSNKNFSFEEIVNMYTALRTHNIVEEWNKLAERIAEIKKPHEMFLNLINRMMHYKKLEISDNYRLSAKTNSGKKIKIEQMSSGEKQLLILFGEALFQKNQPWIYVADEPELSLHITWQEQLIQNIKYINNNAQIIFATHSPDVVSTFSDKTVDMEGILK